MGGTLWPNAWPLRAAPLGVAPMGGPSIVWPGADRCLAAACQRANVPYTLGLVGGASAALLVLNAHTAWIRMPRPWPASGARWRFP